MPKKKSNKSKKRQNFVVKKDVTLKDEDQTYGRVTKVHGLWVDVHCYDKYITRLCRIRGRVKRRRPQISDLVLVSLRSFEESKSSKRKADIILKYSTMEEAQLKKMGEIDSKDDDPITNEKEEESPFVFEDI